VLVAASATTQTASPHRLNGCTKGHLLPPYSMRLSGASGGYIAASLAAMRAANRTKTRTSWLCGSMGVPVSGLR
jgi:hypothetical protein